MEPTEVIAVVSMFIVVGLTARSLITNVRRQRTAKLQADVMNKLIDRVGSSPELAKWLESGGPRLLEFETERSSPHARILNSVQAGLIAAALGVGLITVAAGEAEIRSAGIILVMVGMGFLASAVAAFFLSKSWGILKTDAERPGLDGQ
jgi:hypothetical protein